MSALRPFIYSVIPQRHFEEYTLSKSELDGFVRLFVGALLGLSLFGVLFLRHEQKRFAWLISMVNSGIMTVAGVVYCIEKLSQYPGVITQTHMDKALFQQVDDFSFLMMLWFSIANIFDLVVGVIFYRKYVGLLTGWIHHTLFLWIVYAGTTGNALYGECYTFAAMFLLLSIEEFPTFLLALGSMFPSCRADLLFGISFFLLRCLYHLYMFVYILRLNWDYTLIGIFINSLFMHFNWFYQWASKYGSYKEKSKKELKKSN